VKRVLLLRHAKAVSGGAKIDDHERELAPRGREDAPAIGRYMHKHGFEPDLMLVSTARRTVETAELAWAELMSRPPIEFLDSLYLAEAGAIATILRTISETFGSVCVVAHNPGMETAASLLAREPVKRKERDYVDLIEEKFPTGALCVLDFDARGWRDVKPRTGTLSDFVRPRDL
jgi:phosphohistidine phosphatase